MSGLEFTHTKMMNNNKRGIIRILEAFLAILLILGATVFVFSRFSQENYESQNIIDLEKSIINQISSTPEFRDEVLRYDGSSEINSRLINFISDRIPSNYEFEFKICPIEDICSASQFHNNLYAHERIIASNLEEYNPVKIKLYIWRMEVESSN